MDAVYFDITIDMQLPDVTKRVAVKQYADKVPHLRVTITDGGVPYSIGSGVTARLEGTRSDGSGMMVDGTTNSNIVDITLNESVLAISGPAVADVNMTGSAGAMRTPSFIVDIAPAALTREEIENSDGYQSIDAIKQQTQQYMQAAQAAQEAAENAEESAMQYKNDTADLVDEAESKLQDVQLAASQVQAIVAGNEAYTKAESDQKYATAPYKTTTGSGYVVVEDGDNGTAEVGFFGNSVQDGTPSPDSPIPVISVGEIPKDSNGKEIRNLLDEAGVMANTVSSFSANGTLRFSAELIGEKVDDFGLTVGGKAVISSGTPTSSGTFAASGTVAISVTGDREDLKNYRVMITDAATIDAYRPYIGENNGLLRVVNTTGSEQRDGWIQLKEPLRKVGDIADSIAPDGTVVQRIIAQKPIAVISLATSTDIVNRLMADNNVFAQNFKGGGVESASTIGQWHAFGGVPNELKGTWVAAATYRQFYINDGTPHTPEEIETKLNAIRDKIVFYGQPETPITYSTPMPDFITGEGVTTFLTPDGEVVPDIFVRYKQTVKGAALEMIEDDKNRKIYGVSITKQENGNIQSSPTLTRTDDAVGLTAQATTNGAAVTNDFDTAADWPKMFRCNGYYSDTGQFIITSKKGEPGYDAINQDVFWCCERFYHKRTETSEAITHQISTKPFPGAVLPTVFTGKDGEALDYWVTGAYEGALVDNRLVSRSGLIPGDRVSMNTGITYCRNAGEYYHLQTSDEKETLRLLIMIEFATLNTQTALGEGATGLRYASDQATVATTNGNRFITTNAIADTFVVGQTIAIGTSAQGNNIANNRIITSITTYDSNNKAINFDGAAVTIAVGNYISSRPWKTGDTDSVVASSGSKGSKHSTMYRGYENPFGNCWEVVGDMIFHNGSSTYYKCADPDKWVTNGVLTDDYIPLAYGAPAAEGYCTKLGYDPRFPYTALTEAVGGSSSAYYCDYFYRNASTVSPDTLREVLVGGNVTHGVTAGLSCWRLSDAVSNSYWTVAGRLSGTGRGGPGETSPGNTAS